MVLPDRNLHQSKIQNLRKNTNTNLPSVVFTFTPISATITHHPLVIFKKTSASKWNHPPLPNFIETIDWSVETSKHANLHEVSTALAKWKCARLSDTTGNVNAMSRRNERQRRAREARSSWFIRHAASLIGKSYRPSIFDDRISEDMFRRSDAEGPSDGETRTDN